jgi:hypothetical protein
VLPAGRWRCVLDSARPAARGSGTLAGVIEAPAQSVLVLCPAE